MKANDRGARCIKITLDGETAELLDALSDMCHAAPETVAASLLRDVLQDDEETNFLLEAPAASAAIN
jgi:hypothetical protein